MPRGETSFPVFPGEWPVAGRERALRRDFINSMPDLQPEGTIWNLIFWIVVGLLVFVIADSVFYGLAPDITLDVPKM